MSTQEPTTAQDSISEANRESKKKTALYDFIGRVADYLPKPIARQVHLALLRRRIEDANDFLWKNWMWM